MSMLSEDEKRQAIFDVALKHFIQNGYSKASTNEIVKEIGISKGILFHYFKNKKNLYLYILDTSIDYFVDYFKKGKNAFSSDIFERILEITQKKLDLFYENPLLYQFVANAFIQIPLEFEKDIKNREQRLATEYLPLFLKDLDTSKFKDDIDKEKAIELVITAIDALSKKYMAQNKDEISKGLENLRYFRDDLKEYIHILKAGKIGRASCRERV